MFFAIKFPQIMFCFKAESNWWLASLLLSESRFRKFSGQIKTSLSQFHRWAKYNIAINLLF